MHLSFIVIWMSNIEIARLQKLILPKIALKIYFMLIF